MKKIVLATNNKNKLKEYQQILKDYEIMTLEDIHFYNEIEETGDTFLENALIKAKTIHHYLKKIDKEYIVVSEDSGLCLDSLNGAPGVYSARYSGMHGEDQKNRDKLRRELKGKKKEASFTCTIVVYYPNGEYQSFVGKTEGKIMEEELGKKDFGYDCIFYSKELQKTFGEAREEEKNKVSHRGRAIQNMKKSLCME